MESQSIKYKKLIFIAAILFLLDAIILNQGAIAIILILIIIFWWLPKSVLKKSKGFSPKKELIKVLIFGLATIAILSANAINNNIAKNRANKLIKVIEKYHETNGRYPQTLTELLPEHILKIPKAKFTLMFNSFKYIKDNGSASIFYVSLPPFGRPTYIFNRKEWVLID